jgi:hypothetical protein
VTLRIAKLELRVAQSGLGGARSRDIQHIPPGIDSDHKSHGCGPRSRPGGLARTTPHIEDPVKHPNNGGGTEVDVVPLQLSVVKISEIRCHDGHSAMFPATDVCSSRASSSAAR